jgi:TonB family protein
VVLVAQAPEPIEKQLEGQTMLLRGFLAGSKIEYTETGEPLHPLFGVWTMHGYVRVDKVESKQKEVRIKADRLAAVYDAHQRKFQNFRYSDSVELRFPRNTDQQVASALMRIFVSRSESFEDLLPLPWKRFFKEPSEPSALEPTARDSKSCPPPKYGASAVCAGAIPPQVTFQPEPSFSDPATELNVTGVTSLICTLSENGTVQIEKINRPLGAGLDEQAIAAVQQWIFKPAMKDGKPFKALFAVDVEFRR